MRLHLKPKNIVIVGPPKTGKTTLALTFNRPTLHTDDLISKHWSDIPKYVAEWMHKPGPWTIEGTQTARALRYWLVNYNDHPPVDLVIVLRKPHVTLTPEQERMGKGILTVWMADVEPRIACPVLDVPQEGA